MTARIITQEHIDNNAAVRRRLVERGIILEKEWTKRFTFYDSSS